jgi:hypothetical protein
MGESAGNPHSDEGERNVKTSDDGQARELREKERW